MKHFVQRGLRDRSAGVALMFAVGAIPIIGTIGIAVDLGLVTQAKTQLNVASDAAALAAAKAAADAFSAGQPNYIATGQKAGVEWFKSQASSVLGPVVPAPSVTVTQSGAVFSSQVTYQGAVAPYFAPIFGVSTVAVGGLSSATITTTAYVSVTFLLDDSSSMLIAATQDGVTKMNSLTPYSTQAARNTVPRGLGGTQCVFACHWDANNNDYYGMAIANGIQIRFDILKSATAAAINQMISQQKIDGQFSVAIDTFDRGLKVIVPDSTNLTNALSAAKIIVPPTDEYPDGTNFPAAMQQLAQASTAAGNGSSMASPRKALIIVTDGLADYGARSIPSSRGPINPADCTAMKNLGYNVYVLYTTYVTEPQNVMLSFDNGPIADYVSGNKTPAMVPSLQSCASAPTNYAQASDPAAITTAMTQMLQSALGNGGRYTQ